VTCARHDGPLGKCRAGGPSFAAVGVKTVGPAVIIFPAMGFRVISGTSVQEFVENIESATAALDAVRTLMKAGLPNVRILTEGGRILSLSELESLAEFENA
jgi:hypothetical protein